jgi:nitroreductase
MHNDVLDAIRSRRSIRQFQDKPVETPVIETLLEAGRLAPTAMGKQACHFLVVTDREVIAKLSTMCVDLVTFVMKHAWITKWFVPVAGDKEFRKIVLSRRGGREDPVYYKAPCIIALAAPKDNHHGVADCMVAAENIMIAATSLGLGTVLVGYGAVFGRRKEGRELVGLPKDMDVHGVVCVGYPEKEPEGAPERKENLIGWVGG